MKTWDEFFSFLLTWEGTIFENDPDDPGGATKFGIDQRSHPTVNIAELTREDAKNIYLQEFGASFASKLPPSFCWLAFDATVNCGESRSVRFFQRALYVTEDGKWGVKSLSAFERLKNDNALSGRVLTARNDYHHSIAKGRLAKFLRGWLNRTLALATFIGTK